jgi:hypothetical protein
LKYVDANRFPSTALPFRDTGVINRHAREAQKGSRRNTNMANEATNTAATIAEQGAHIAPEQAPSKKGASQKKGAPKGQKTAKVPKAKATPKKAAKTGKKPARAKDGQPRTGTKTTKILELIGRPKGATLSEIQKATDWQAHYADVRIMPTCVGNPVWGAGIAAMESA